MSWFQVVALAFTILSALGLVSGFVWVMIRSGGQSGQIAFANIKQAVVARQFRLVAPVLLAMLSLYLLLFGVAMLLFAFDAPFIVSVIWLVAAICAVVQTVRAFARV